MVMEIKVLSFNKNEITSAVMRQLLRGDEQGREFFVKSLVINKEAPVSVKLTMERPSGRVEERDLDHGFLAASMLRYCMDNKIPMARSANKDLHILNGRLSLFLSMDNKDTR